MHYYFIARCTLNTQVAVVHHLSIAEITCLCLLQASPLRFWLQLFG